jgi:two-component system, NarL family, sensor histidine kinase DesK
VDALLAWTVREASTNIVRHSGARDARITVTVTGASAGAELTDDGAGPPAGRGTPAGGGVEPGGAGSGLAGLAERAGRLGGTLLAGAGRHGGFRVRVTVPLTAAAPGAPDTVPAGPGARAGPGAPDTVPAAPDQVPR